LFVHVCSKMTFSSAHT